jgi:5'-phosphate synthase pdxT subunit
MAKIGVLALQGEVQEHLRLLHQVGAEAIAVKKTEQLAELDGLVLPGGESTAIGYLMNAFGFMNAIVQFHHEHKPIFGTAAGMILLAKQIEGEKSAYLGIMDIQVRRNGFGREHNRFESELMVPGIAVNYMAPFIRAPYATKVMGDVQVLAKHDGKAVALQQNGLLLATSFHPELTDDPRFHEYFADMVYKAKLKRKR